jgi:hypothetical protein
MIAIYTTKWKECANVLGIDHEEHEGHKDHEGLRRVGVGR